MGVIRLMKRGRFNAGEVHAPPLKLEKKTKLNQFIFCR